MQERTATPEIEFRLSEDAGPGGDFLDALADLLIDMHRKEQAAEPQQVETTRARKQVPIAVAKRTKQAKR